MPKQYNLWWGPPKKFSTHFEDRKISWLELFYDLVYVIVISRTTQYLAAHTSADGIMDYAYLFIMIFWSWFNGSQYYDLHGSPGVRTRFMTLWQMVAVAALAVTLYSPPDKLIFRATISVAALQLFITYLWWSVGIYDREHRRLNVPYTICYLAALALIITTLFIPPPYKRILFWITLALNYMPSFISRSRLEKRNETFSLSTSMAERLGLFTIIVFGEVILGVINAMSAFSELHTTLWICFGLGILITFSLWWIFFSIIADREVKKGFIAGNAMSLTYIPALSSLGMVGAAFPGLMAIVPVQTDGHFLLARNTYGISIALFLCSISAISYFLVYPVEYNRSKKLLQPLLPVAGTLILIISVYFQAISVIQYLLSVFIILLSLLIIIIRSWYRVELLTFRKQAGRRGAENNLFPLK